MEVALFKTIADFGVIPTIVFLMTVAYFMLRDQKKSIKDMEQHLADGQSGLKEEIDSVKNDLLSQLHTLKDQSSRRDRELKRRIGALEVRVVALENGVLRREQLEEITAEIRREIAVLERSSGGMKNGQKKQG